MGEKTFLLILLAGAMLLGLGETVILGKATIATTGPHVGAILFTTITGCAALGIGWAFLYVLRSTDFDCPDERR